MNEMGHIIIDGVLIIKKYGITILMVLLLTIIGVSYIVLRLADISNAAVMLVTLSLMILPVVCIYFFVIRPWAMSKIILYLALVFSLGVSYFIIPASQKDFFNQMLVWVLPVLEVSIVIIVIYSIIKSIIRYNTNHEKKQHNVMEAIRASLEPKLGSGFITEALLTELSVINYSILIWFQKPYKDWEYAYTYHKTSQLKMIIIVFSILIVLEGIFFHFLFQLWSNVLAWVFTVLNIYALMYMVGLYQSVKLLPYYMEDDKLTIRFGFQSSVEVDIANIQRISAGKEIEFGAKIPKSAYYALLKIDTPNVELLLKEPTPMRSSYRRKQYVDTVVFRADQPDKIIHELHSKMKLFTEG